MGYESPAAFNQSGSYGAEQTRRAIFSAYARTVAGTPGIISGGLIGTADLQLSAPVSGLTVNVSTGEAIIGGSEGGVQGGYYARANSTTNLGIATAHATLPRIDTVCGTISDSAYGEPVGGSGNQWALQVVTGTATSGATLANLTGAATLPLSSLLLGYVLVPATATNIITADISNIATSVTVNMAMVPASSMAGYQWGYDQITAPVTVAASTEATGTTIIACGAHTFDGSPVMAEFVAPYVQTGAGTSYVVISLFEGATQIGRIGETVGATATGPFSAALRFTPTVGAHTYTVSAYYVSATGIVGAGVSGTGAFVPAFVRFTKI